MTRDIHLAVKSVSKHFGGLKAISGVNIELERNNIYCIIGPNGAGKSTLLNMVCGTIAPSEGDILVNGQSLLPLTKSQIARLGIARKFQVPSVFGSLSVEQNMEVAARSPAAKTPAKRLTELLQLVALESTRATLASHLAHGQKQWLEIGMALATSPSLLLLDEPTAGMSPEETAKTANLIKRLKGQVTVLAIEHDMAFVRALACETIVMHQGTVIASGPFDQIASNEMVRDVYLGRSSHA